MSTQINDLADAIMDGLEEYFDIVTDDVKDAVTKAAKTVKSEIEATAPSNKGNYKKSWRTQKTKENSTSLVVTVYSQKRYMIAHLLEHGHAKRNGGRVSAQVHIAPAEEKGVEELEKEIERSLGNG